MGQCRTLNADVIGCYYGDYSSCAIPTSLFIWKNFFSLTLCLPPSYCITSLFLCTLDMYVARVNVCTVL